MGWNIGLVAIESSSADDVIAQLELTAPQPQEQTGIPPTTTLADATADELADDYWGIGTLGRLTLLTSRWVTEHADVWKRVSKHGRVVAFWLSENHETNCLYIFEGGEQVIARVQGKRAAWKPKHPLEKGAKPSGHKADFIGKVFENLTGHVLFEQNVITTPMALRGKPTVTAPAIDEGALAAARTHFADTIAKPLPHPESAWHHLEWNMRWKAIEDCLAVAWASDRTATEATWIPQALAEVERWPDERRTVSRARFETIAKGQDDGLSIALAPLFRSLTLDGPGTPKVRFRAKPFARFFAHPVMSELRRLDFGCTSLPSEVAELVADCERVSRLTYLSFDRTFIGNRGVAALARSHGFASLNALNLHQCSLDRDGLAQLLESPFLPALAALRIGGNNLGTTGAAMIAECTRFTSLRTLSLGIDPTLDAAGVRALLDSPHLPSLTTLEVATTAIDAATAAELQARRPGLTIVTTWTAQL